MGNIFERTEAVLLLTGMKDNDRMVKSIADEAYKADPAAFEGDVNFIYYKCKYVSPFNKFGELKSLILKIRAATGMRHSYKGIVAIDLHEWIGHQNEEFFEIILKYLYDHKSLYKYIFTFRDSDREKIKPVYLRCIHYFRSAVVDRSIFSDTHISDLTVYIRESFHVHSAVCDEQAVKIIADIFADKRNKEIKTLERLELIIQDCAEQPGGKKITKKSLIKDLAEGRLVLNMLLEQDIIKKIIAEGETEGGKTGHELFV